MVKAIFVSKKELAILRDMKENNSAIMQPLSYPDCPVIYPSGEAIPVRILNQLLRKSLVYLHEEEYKKEKVYKISDLGLEAAGGPWTA